MSPSPDHAKSLVHQLRIFFLVTTLLLTSIACSAPRMLFETFVSPSDMDSQTVATWEEEYADEYDLEVVEDDGPSSSPATEEVPPAQSSQLTPQEEKHQGTHHYQISGTTTPMLGSDGTIEDSGVCNSEFTEEGVYFQLLDYDAGFFRRISENNYEQITEAGTKTTLEYTDTGILYYSLTETGIFQDMTLTLDD